MKTRRVVLGILIAGMMAAAVFGQDWKGTARISGTVVDQEGDPIQGATVTVRVARDPEAGPEPVTTDRRGRWAILGLAGGTWHVLVEAEGFASSEGEVDAAEYGATPPIRTALRRPDPGELRAAALTEADLAIERGDELLLDQQPAEARAAYEEALPHLEGDNLLIVLRRIATSQMMEGQDAAAVTTLERALEVAPEDVESLRLIVDRLVVLGREDEAENYMERLPSDYALDSVTRLNVGIRNYNEGDLEGAIEQFDAAVRENPEVADVYYYRGMAHLGLGRAEEAKADFEKVLELEPDHARADEIRELLDAL